MKQEDKELLLKDLSARLPYGVICQVQVNDIPQPLALVEIDMLGCGTFMTSIVAAVKHIKNIGEVKPYLRPMSSMTEEELKYLKEDCGFIYDKGDDDIYNYNAADRDYNIVLQEDIVDISDFCYSHHLDFRGLIPKGLALEAKEGMYENKGMGD